MSSSKHTSSGSGEEDRYEMMDEKKRKRMISNRESAKRSRMKREQHMKDLNDQLIYLQNKRNEMVQKINELEQVYAIVESENRILIAQQEELSRRLESAEIIASYLDETSGYSMSVHQDPWLKPWQPPVASQPIVTSAGIFQF